MPDEHTNDHKEKTDSLISAQLISPVPIAEEEIQEDSLSVTQAAVGQKLPTSITEPSVTTKFDRNKSLLHSLSMVILHY